MDGVDGWDGWDNVECFTDGWMDGWEDEMDGVDG